MVDGYELTTKDPPPAEAYAEVRALVDQARATDGVEALNEAALLNLRHSERGVRHLWLRATSSSELAGYAQLADGPETRTGQLVVAPAHRGRGLGRTLLLQLLADTGGELRIWAMGDAPPAQALAARTGLTPQRTLLIMQRPLTEPVTVRAPPPGITIRSFRPGHDEPAWLALNAKAFAHHPEQGRLTAADLEARMAETWFDPAGFFVAVQGHELVGFHWTKQHTAPDDKLGEVYVLGVDPAAGGRGLGKVLLTTGLAHLRRRGNTAVELYVEADHVAAVGLYRSSGFVEVSRDVMYGRA